MFSDRVAYVVTNNGAEPFDHLTVNFSLNKGFSFDADIAHKCGFKDVEHFCRMFKKRTGITAGMMRNK